MYKTGINLEVKPVLKARDLRDFVYFPELLYSNDPGWAPPLWSGEYREYRYNRNAVLNHSEYQLFTVCHGGSAAGRIIAYVDRNFNRFYNSATGFFGAFECIDNYTAAEALYQKAESWLRDRGMTEVRGPVDPVAEKWGFVCEGAGTHPVYMSPYNPGYYNDFAEKAGYSKAKDLLVYEADMNSGYVIPDRFVRFSEKFLSDKPEFSVRKLDIRNLKNEAVHIWRIMNTAVRNNWGFVPLERNEVEDLVKKMKPIADPDAVWFVEHRGNPVGCALGFPDINILIKDIRGRMLPFGFLKFISGLKKLRDYRLWALAVLEEYHGLGLDVLLYTALNNALADKKIRMEANYILEDNPNIRNALEKLGMSYLKKYRVYEKKLVKTEAEKDG